MSEQAPEVYFNPWDDAFKANPYPHYKPLIDGPPRIINLMLPIALVGKYDSAVRILTDHETFTAIKPDSPWIQQQFEIFRGAPILQNTDPPIHTRLRRVIGRAFNPHTVGALEPRIREITGELLDRSKARGDFEVMGDLANPLPVMVIAEMLGVPSEKYRQFKQWCDAFVAGQTVPPGSPVPDQTKAANDSLREYFAAEIEKRKRQKGSDLISQMMAAEEQDGEALTPEELLAFVVLLLIAGNETTTNLIGNGMLALGQNPEALPRLRSDSSLLPRAIEEMMRYDGPIQVSLALPVVRKPVEIEGVKLDAGTLMFVILAAANRDPARFASPDTFDIARDPNPHLAFGEGIHHCLGAPLARLEGRIAFEMALNKFPALRLADPDAPLRYKGSYFFRGLSELKMAI
jgi:cytochrome P450